MGVTRLYRFHHRPALVTLGTEPVVIKHGHGWLEISWSAMFDYLLPKVYKSSIDVCNINTVSYLHSP
jgi:hypothetical protein